MRIQTILLVSVLALCVGPLSAAHRHGRDCGHRFDSHQGSWISVHAVAPFGFSVAHRNFAPSPYRQGYHNDSRRFKRGKRYRKHMRKQQRRHERQFHRHGNRHGHRHGPYGWR